MGEKLKVRAMFLSDAHLGTRDAQCGHLYDLLRHTESEYLYLLGDMVDFWKARSGWYWPPLHSNIVQLILDKARRGTRVLYIPGNHDEWLRAYVGAHYHGVEICGDGVHTTLRGERWLLLHGDEFDEAVRHNRLLTWLGDGAYDLLLRLNRWHHRLRQRLGRPYWSLSAFLKGQVKNAMAYVDRYERAVAHEACRRGFDGVVCGHIHQAALKAIAGVRYANTGDWVEHCTTLVETNNGELHLIRWAEESRHWVDAGAAPAVMPVVARRAA